jgi:hypothetical protein
MARLQFVRASTERAREAEDRARQGLEQATKTREYWDAVLANLEAGDHASALLVLRKGEEDIGHLEGLDESAERILRDVRESCERQAREAASRFGRVFPEAARSAGLHIDTTSRHPRYTFEQGFIHVEVNERQFTAKVATRDGDEAIVGLDVTPLVERVKAERSRLFDREFQPDALLQSIYRAYLAVLRAEDRAEGEEVPLRRLTNRLSKNLNRFAADEFNVDLSRLIRSSNLVVSGHRLQINHTRNMRQGMLLQGLEQGGYVGFISFKKEGGA